MSEVDQHCEEIKKVNPTLSKKECLIIHTYMNDMACILEMINIDKFTLSTFKGMMEEHFLNYDYSYSTIMDYKNPKKGKEAILISRDNMEFNVFLERGIKVVVFRTDNYYRQVFEMSVTQDKF